MFAALRLGRQLALRAPPRPSSTAGPSRILLQSQLTLPRSFHATPPAFVTLNQSSKRKRNARRVAKSKSPLLNNSPQRKGVCIQVFTAKPKKPNSGKRKVARVKLSTGKTCQAYKVVRGALDLGGVVNRARARSRYGVKKPKK
ncbi:hypothetical protein MIND_01140200 [Mycena indigotica]|uniref:Ribosomal protein S12 n=1 Tax=Mycena indigotica TaxID=2126181 RepID=A0A8H6S7I0_9AGAR|nr:uncharacterized protein MIND_01140200 [Mycena indigotica]KAF7293610.1 hypothetical protein MIND_01140200 [Mycena indigotica]